MARVMIMMTNDDDDEEEEKEEEELHVVSAFNGTQYWPDRAPILAHIN